MLQVKRFASVAMEEAEKLVEDLTAESATRFFCNVQVLIGQDIKLGRWMLMKDDAEVVLVSERAYPGFVVDPSV